MKRSIFVRHAKSSWDNPSLRDIERPLNKRGLSDAPLMASRMKSYALPNTIIVSSPANRAYSTARYFAKEIQISFDDVLQIEDLYMASRWEVVKVVENLPDEVDCAFIFGHNPCQTSLINFFGADSVHNVPTCGAFVVDSDCEHWSDFIDTKPKIKAYYYPKMFK